MTNTQPPESFQIPVEAAESYEATFVPAFFAQWAPILCDAAALPLADRSFDAVLCQMALMFFPDRIGALREMARVAARSGTVAVLVPAGLGAQPAFGPFIDMAARQAGPEARSLLDTYFACGDLDELTSLFGRAGLRVTGTQTHSGTARFGSVDAFVTTEVESTPLRERISAGVYHRIKQGAREVLAPFTAAEGTLAAPFVVHVAVAARTVRP